MLGKIALSESHVVSHYQEQEKIDHLELIASGVAHDFNNLLTSILGQSSLALRQLPPGNHARRHIEKAMKAAEYATLLTRQLQAFAKNGRCETEGVNLNQIASDNASLLQTTFKEDVTLNLDLAPYLPLVIASPGQIQQVVMNLIINASEAIQGPAGTVTVRTGRQKRLPEKRSYFSGKGRAGLRDYVFIQVSDTGTGIDEKTLSRMFEPFFTTKKHGKGVGLSAVREIVSKYEGEITVESKLGVGTTITVYLQCCHENHPHLKPVH